MLPECWLAAGVMTGADTRQNHRICQVRLGRGDGQDMIRYAILPSWLMLCCSESFMQSISKGFWTRRLSSSILHTVKSAEHICLGRSSRLRSNISSYSTLTYANTFFFCTIYEDCYSIISRSIDKNGEGRR